MPSLHWRSISKKTFDSTLQRYDEQIPQNLQELEIYRMTELPRLVKERSDKNNGGTWMEKDELVRLVEWKLKHGTFRPKLLQLVSSNTSEEIESLTKSVFNAHTDSSKPDRPALANQLTKLKGIGPATASLILATFDPNTVLFFGDEAFRWLSWDEPPKGPKGWERKIGYTAKEYRRLDELVSELRERLSVKAVEIEKCGYVLGKEHANIDDGEPGRDNEQEPMSKVKKVEEKVVVKKDVVKRKMDAKDTEVKGRRSKRLAPS